MTLTFIILRSSISSIPSIAFIFFLAAVLVLLACDRRLAVRTYTMDSPKRTEPLRILLLTDLHGFRYGKHQKNLLKAIARHQPQLILMAGDMVDDKRRLEGSALFFKHISGIAPTYYTPGNHEYRRNWTEINTMAQNHGIIVLSDRWESLEQGSESLILAGADDPEKRLRWDSTYNANEALERTCSPLTGRPELRILLAHRPDRIERYQKYGFDLVVSGHAHGGQIRIPGLLNGLFAPNQGFFPPYAGGLYPFGKTCLVVSRGLAKPVLLPKVFNRPEIVVIDIIPSPSPSP